MQRNHETYSGGDIRIFELLADEIAAFARDMGVLNEFFNQLNIHYISREEPHLFTKDHLPMRVVSAASEG